MKISIVGCGWYGSALAQLLKQDFHVLGTTRSETKKLFLQGQGIETEILAIPNKPSDRIMNVDAMILNIPPFPEQLNWLKTWNWNPGTHLIFISSTSVYAVTDQIVDESTPTNPDTEAGLILKTAEEWIQTFSHFDIIRFGGLIGPGRHPGTYLSGKKDLLQGNRPVNLIHLDDCLSFTKDIIVRGSRQELYNLVHPSHPTREDYYTDYCRNHHLPLPHFKAETQSYGYVSSFKVMKNYQFKKAI